MSLNPGFVIYYLSKADKLFKFSEPPISHLFKMNKENYTSRVDMKYLSTNWASQVALVVKSPPVNAGDLRDRVLIPGSGRSPGGGHATYSIILAWRIPWTEEPGGL